MWIWDERCMTNSIGWGINLEAEDGGKQIIDAIADNSLVGITDNSLVGITDGSYICKLCQHLCSAAVISECSKGRDRMVVACTENCLNATAYRRELLGLNVLHLFL